MSFTSLGLSDAIVRAVTEQGYTSPTPIQMQAIPVVLGPIQLRSGGARPDKKPARQAQAAPAKPAQSKRSGGKPTSETPSTPHRSGSRAR